MLLQRIMMECDNNLFMSFSKYRLFQVDQFIVRGSRMHDTHTLIAYCGRTVPDRGRRIDECRQSGRGEGWRTSLTFFFPLSAGRWPLAQWYEENVTQHYPLSLLQTQMKFYFLCHTLERKQFLLLLINVCYMGWEQEGCKEKNGVLSLVPTLCLSLISHILMRVIAAPPRCQLGGTSTTQLYWWTIPRNNFCPEP